MNVIVPDQSIVCKVKTIEDMRGIGYFYSVYQATRQRKYKFVCHLYTAKFLDDKHDQEFMESFEKYRSECGRETYHGKPVPGRNAPKIIPKGIRECV